MRWCVENKRNIRKKKETFEQIKRDEDQMTKGITIRDDLYAELRTMRIGKESFSDVIDKFLHPKSNNLQEAEVNPEGRFPGSKTLAGKTIIYKIKE